MVGGVVVVAVVVATGAVATAYFPFIPALAWPKSVQRNAYWPFFGNLTVSIGDLPGSSDFVFLPAILKSCEILPLLRTVKITVPVGTLLLEKVYLNSNAFTVTFVAGVRRCRARPAGRQEDPGEHTGQRQCRQPSDPGDPLHLNVLPH